MLPDLGLACAPRITAGLARLEAHCALDCGCCLTIDVLTGDRLAMALICVRHLAAIAFADHEC